MASVGEVRMWLDNAINRIEGPDGALIRIAAVNEEMADNHSVMLRIIQYANEIPQRSVYRLPSHTEYMRSDMGILRNSLDGKVMPLAEAAKEKIVHAKNVVQAAADGTQQEALKTASAYIAEAETRMDNFTGTVVSISEKAASFGEVPSVRLAETVQEAVGMHAVAVGELETAYTRLLGAVELIRAFGYTL